MNRTIVRGRLLSFSREPESSDDHSAYVLHEDGALLLEDGRILLAGDFPSIKRQAGQEPPVIDHRPHLVLPGFVDTHAHFVQMQVIASHGTELLDWLTRYTFVEEARFGDIDHGRRIAGQYLDELLRNGTTTASVYCSVHAQSAEAFFQEAHQRNMLMVAGKVMMDRNAPDMVRDTAQQAYDESQDLIARWHGRGRQHYAITPRFAITSSPAQLEVAGALARAHPDLHVQTHLAENQAETAWARELYPEARDYTDIYARYGLMGPRSLFGHCIYLSEREIDALAQTRSVAVFCPTSNTFLGSGLFDYKRYRQRDNPLRLAVATDVGGGTSYSMLRTMDEGYKVIALNGHRLDPLVSFWQITLGNACALSLRERIGTLEPGSDADLVVLDASATPAMRLRMETVETLAQELFVLQTMGDDRAVKEVYVGGVAAKTGLSSAAG